MITDADIEAFFQRAKAKRELGHSPELKKTWAMVHPEIGVDLRLISSVMADLRQEQEGVVYFLAGGDKVKIGKSKEPTERLRAIQSMSPIPLKFVGHVVGYTRTERRLHEKWSAKRSHGEWFHYDEELHEWILTNTGRFLFGLEDALATDLRFSEAYGRVSQIIDLVNSLYSQAPERAGR